MIVALLASAFAICSAGASAAETGSDGAPLNGMAALYVPLPHAGIRAATATITLPAIRSNKAWYANWIMLVGQSPTVPHQMFVQIGLIRRPTEGDTLHVFTAWQGAGRKISYDELSVVRDTVHRFAIVQNGDDFTLTCDGKAIAALKAPQLAHAIRKYVEIGPEVYAEGDALSGAIHFAALESGQTWRQVGRSDACHYDNHGVHVVYRNGSWVAAGRFDRRIPSAYRGNCIAG